jgi:hypothetical protein
MRSSITSIRTSGTGYAPMSLRSLHQFAGALALFYALDSYDSPAEFFVGQAPLFLVYDDGL